MSFTRNDDRLFVPDRLEPAPALARTTHLGIGAHQDDLEFMALHGILECFDGEEQWFGGVTCTSGAGSARAGPYAGCSDEQMQAIRAEEQNAAAVVGRYGFMAQLGHPSVVAKQANRRSELVDDLEQILLAACPKVVYTHNPFDKHGTHIGVLAAVLEAVRRLPGRKRPSQLFGCEVWRGLDWLPDDRKVVHPLDAHPNLAAALNGIFDSQISGGKRYDLAVEGRRRANATFLDSHAVDRSGRVGYAVDLSGLMGEGPAALTDFCREIIRGFEAEVLSGNAGRIE